jgi:HlyD family secretion protein
MGGFGGGMGGGMGGGGQRPGGNGGAAGGGRPQQVPVRTSPGFVDLYPQAAQQGGAQQGGRQQGGSFGGQLPSVTDAQCKAIETARKAKPAAAKKVDDLQAKMRDPNADRQALNTELRTAYTELGVEANVVRACRMKEMAGTQGGGAPAAGAPNATPQPAAGNAGGNAARSGGAMQRQQGGASTPARGATRTGLVFVQKADSTWEARVVRLGTADYDYTEVISGLQEGERVALLSAAALQLQRQNQADRFKAMTGGSSPLGGATGGGRGPGR